ncbi:hypothetical protein ACIRS3_36730 [Streptomyces virginiae]|uniref:hypothetical protein n=1 Tax=Streptomyces virginiae TaxID=1961 RepID=UPI003830F20A
MDPINALGEVGVDVLACGPTMSRRCPPRGSLATAGRPPVTVVVDRHDDERFTHAALAAHHPPAGHFVVHPTVAPRSRFLWQDILHTLGQDTRARSGGSWTVDEQHRTVHTTLTRRPRCRITVLRTHRLGEGLWADLIHLHLTTNAELILVHHGEPGDSLTQLLRHCDHRTLTGYTGMLRLHPPRPAPPVPGLSDADR